MRPSMRAIAAAAVLLAALCLALPARAALPVAFPQSVDVRFETPTPITLDAEAGAVSITYAIATPPAHGSVQLLGSYATYTPTAGFVGSDSFTFTVTTVNGTSAPAMVSLNVLALVPPTVPDASAVVPYNTSWDITLLFGDTNPGGPFQVSFAIVTPPVHGSVVAHGRTATYVPTLGYSGADSFTYTASTINGTSSAATMSLTVAPGVLPVAQAGSTSTPYETSVPIALAASDANPGGPFAFAYAIATPPQHGTIGDFDAGAGTLTYTPDSGYSCSDVFSFTATTINGTSAPAAVNLMVVPPPSRLASCGLTPSSVQINDSGQTFCTDATGSTVSCKDPSAAQGQDAQRGRDALAATGALAKAGGGAAGFDFDALDATGAVTAQGGHACVADHVTGLLWSTETLGARSWDDAMSAAAGYSRCGVDADWRLPTRRELLSIVDHGASAPAIDGSAFPGTASAPYWSGDGYANDATQAWAVDFTDGDTQRADKARARAVRLVTAPAANHAPRITPGADIVVPREDRPVPLSFPGWATGIAPGPASESDQHLTATLRLLPVTGQKALEFDVPPALDPATGTLTFTIKQRTYPDNGQVGDDPNRDMWYSSAGLARVELTLEDDGGTACGGVDTTTAVFTIFLDPVPAARDLAIKHPWKPACIPVTLAGMDADTDPNAKFVWPNDPWPWPQAAIVTYPRHGFLTDYVASKLRAKEGDGDIDDNDGAAVDDDFAFMFPTTPMQHYGSMDHLRYNWDATVCYVPFSSTFVGSDTFTYRVRDADGNVSNEASVSIEIFEVN